MPRYLLKGLLITFLVLAVVVGAGAGISAIAANRLSRSIEAAKQGGFNEGYSKGYAEGLLLGNEAGYQEGSKAGYIDAGGKDTSQIATPGYYFMYNPTYDEMQMALTRSEMDSAQSILNYARANGIRAAYVRVPIARPADEGRIYLYQLVAFETVDRGLVIIEPRSHREVKVEVGKSYSLLNGFPQSQYDDTITKVTMVW